MESAKIPHHHHHQQQLALPLHQEHHQLLPSSTNLDQYYAAPTSHAWTSNSTTTILNNNTNGRFRLDESHDITPPQDLSFNWGVGNINYNMNHSVHEVVPQICSLKRQLSNSCPNLGEMISSPSSSIEETSSYGKNDPNVNLLLSTLSSSACPEEFIYGDATAKRGSFSQIYPTINVSNLSSHESSFDVNSRALDLLNSSYGYDYVKPSIQRSLESAGNTMMPFGNGGMGGEEKSCNMNCSEGKAPQQKKSRLESGRPSCQPFKVRKEKLGDRIAALQQMVAPFGKTDTASVLMETIGYIKFLQNQVETLSVPYLKSSSSSSSRNNTGRPMHGGAVEEEVHGDEERRRDLRSRGLCLVPMSCLSYMTDSGGSVWPPPPNFGGGT